MVLPYGVLVVYRDLRKDMPSFEYSTKLLSCEDFLGDLWAESGLACKAFCRLCFWRFEKLQQILIWTYGIIVH